MDPVQEIFGEYGDEIVLAPEPFGEKVLRMILDAALADPAIVGLEEFQFVDFAITDSGRPGGYRVAARHVLDNVFYGGPPFLDAAAAFVRHGRDLRVIFAHNGRMYPWPAVSEMK